MSRFGEVIIQKLQALQEGEKTQIETFRSDLTAPSVTDKIAMELDQMDTQGSCSRPQLFGI